jgi:cytochrome c553
MTKKNLTLVLALLLIASVSMWAQTIGTITTTTTNSLQTADQGGADNGGGHMAHGCYLCHVPHTTGTTQQPSATGLTQAALGTAYASGTVPTGGVQGAGTGVANAGTIYLWGQALSPITYTTWDGSGGPLSSSGLTAASPAVHSIMCLSCHDGAVADGTHDMGGSLGGPGTFGTNNAAALNPTQYGGLAPSLWTGNGGSTPVNNGWASSSGLLTNHPVHALYPVKSGDNHYGQYWAVTINPGTGSGSATVTFTDSAFVPYTGGSAYPGHPAKLYSDGTSAYVECTSCHEPHRFGHVAYQKQGTAGTWVVDTSSTPTTVDYIRGPYNLPTGGGNAVANGEQNAGFCRSCHYEKTADYINTNARMQ